MQTPSTQPTRNPKPGNRLFRPSRGKPWLVKLPVVPPIREGGGFTPAIIVYGFAALILIGLVLLMMPVSSKTGQFTTPIDALFTATSAVCVTGLVVVDTHDYWSIFGQAVILVLIQLGGLGFMTSATLFLIVLGRRIGLRERLLIKESLGMESLGGIVKIVRNIAFFTIIIEAIGTGLLFARFLVDNSPGTALWKAVFHSISAFNNAGFDLFGGFRSLIGFHTDPAVLLTIAALVIIGGIGFVVAQDIFKARSLDRLNLDTKLVLTATVSLLIIGTLFYFFTEYSNRGTLGELSLADKVLVSFFQSVTPRTAGFTAINIGNLMGPALFFTIFLMFIGGASGSTAGGVKVGTISLLFATAVNIIRGKEHPGAFGREFNVLNIHRGLALVILYLVIAGVVVIALSITETFSFDKILFETFSCLGTVGLSTGITPELSVPGRLIITIAMFVGRLGPLFMVLSFTRHQRTADYRFPHDTVRIG